MKEEMRTKYKKTIDTITAEQREKILKQGREEGKQAFLAQIAASIDTQAANVTWGGSHRLNMIICDANHHKSVNGVNEQFRDLYHHIRYKFLTDHTLSYKSLDHTYAPPRLEPQS